MSDAEKVVKALRAACIEVQRGEDWHQPEGASDALADFVLAAAAGCPYCGGTRRYLAHPGKFIDCTSCNSTHAALARLAEVLS